MAPATRTQRQTGQRGPSKKTLETRQRIITKATRLFAKQGYHATGVAELSAAVGLGSGALYHHMGSKEELLYEIVRSHIEEVVALGERLLGEDISAREKLQLLARKHMENVANRPLELRVTLREIDSFTGKRRRDMQAIRDRTEEIWEEIVAEGIASGELGQLDPLFVKMILGALNYTVLWYRPGGELTPEAIADRTLRLMLGEASSNSTQR